MPQDATTNPQLSHTQFRVTWAVDVWATSPEDAAKQALEVQRNPYGIAAIFDVCPIGSETNPVSIDLVCPVNNQQPDPASLNHSKTQQSSGQALPETEPAVVGRR